MPKFNVGDRVKILSVNIWQPKMYIGTTGVVQEVSSVPYVRMDIDGKVWTFKEERLELVQKKEQRMKVRVTHKSDYGYWYNSHIGETFEVIEDSNHHGRIFKRADKTYWWIMPEHCEIVKEEQEMEFKVGQKVKVVDTSGSSNAKLGDIATVTKVYRLCNDGFIDVKTEDGREYGMYTYRFELLQNLPPEIKTGHLVMTTFDNQWRLAQVDVGCKGYEGTQLFNFRDFCYRPLHPKEILKIAEAYYIGDIFRAIEAGTPVEQVKGFKIIYDKTKVEREEKLKGVISDLQSQLEKAQKELKEIKEEN